MNKKSIFIFRRDFRFLEDNIGFLNCYQNSSEIYPIFIFNKKQIDPKMNKYFSNNSTRFFIESLHDLNNSFIKNTNSNMHFFFTSDDDTKILKEIKKVFDYDSVFYNIDYTPFARNRDESLKKYCNSIGINVYESEDYLLNKIGTYLKPDNTPYLKFTPFYNYSNKSVSKFAVSKPVYIKNIDKTKFISIEKSKRLFLKKYELHPVDIDKFYKKTKNENSLIVGGRENALKKLDNLKNFKKYDNIRNVLSQYTSLLSAYIKFGLVSIREVYYKIYKLFGKKHTFIKQLFWREFFFYIAYYFPKVLHGKSLKNKYDNIHWENNKIWFKKWCDGKTGFPIVDASMNELNSTGYMQNRARLIVSNFLIKILLIDWKWGERYFATKLIDYDPIVNNGNWQWGAGGGVDSQPYFRIFNPLLQANRFDKECLYIKKWLPELKDVPNKVILSGKTEDVYMKPIVDYEGQRKKALQMYKKGLYK